MVLSGKPERSGLRTLFGAFVIGASVYVFLVGTSLKGSPELLLAPEGLAARKTPCIEVNTPSVSVCVPEGMGISTSGEAIEVASPRERIRGTIRVAPALPREEEWRSSLNRPLIRMFLGDTRKMDAYRLMTAILGHRYNPSLMGAKAAVMPPWMHGDPLARIYTVQGMRGIVFYTPGQSLALAFIGEKVVVVSVTGRIPAATAAGILASVRIPTREEPRRGSSGSS
ncbi:MAG TPA: hypothetical protein PLR71_00990 [Deltaproteobacteria bacterium]|nr:hypothetical protein [Deltaproteobacteria bacterium]HQI80108.1 hypothetical protein [Deltaproteobacteria bacterium]